jgi:uncharacterized protein YbaR (Trm112 family)
MAAEQRPTLTFDTSILEQLACPACMGTLRVDEAQLVCAKCGRGYPVVDGIPVLIVERAVEPSQSVSRTTSSTPVRPKRAE